MCSGTVERAAVPACIAKDEDGECLGREVVKGVAGGHGGVIVRVRRLISRVPKPTYPQFR